MNKVHILLITDDDTYGERLTDCIRKMKSRLKMTRIGSYELEEIIKDASSDKTFNISRNDLKKFKIILMDQSCDTQCLELEEKVNSYFDESSQYVILRLVEETNILNKNEIYKFSKISDLINRSLQRYSFVTGNYIGGHLSSEHDCKIFSVVSSFGGAGCSSISLSVARELALLEDEDTLYISLGSIHQERYFFQWNRSNNIREFLYHMFYGDARYCFSIDSYIKRDDFGLNYFNVNTFTNKIYELSQENFETFINHIISMKLFKNIVFDIGFDTSNKAKFLTSISHKILFITKDKSVTDEAYISYMCFEDSRIITVENFSYIPSLAEEFFKEETLEDEESLEEKDVLRIRKDDEAFLSYDNKIDIRRDTSFSSDVNRLIDIIF